MDAGVVFSHDIAGNQVLDFSANLGIYPIQTVTAIIPTLRNAGISFSHDIAGLQTIQMAATLGVSPVADETLRITYPFAANVGITPALSNPFHLYRTFSADLGISVTFSITLNAGYTNLIMFGELVLRKAHPIDWDEIDLSCREADIWDGTKSLEVMPVSGFYGTYRFYPTDYNDIQTLFSMIGKRYTLRVYGIPYRNCMLWGKIRRKQIRPQVSKWMVDIEIRQDTCITGITE